MSKRRNAGEQLSIDGATSGYRRQRGRVERGVDSDVAKARRDGRLDDSRDGLVASARDVARAIDTATATGAVYALRQLSNELRDLYIELGLSTQETGNDDAFGDFLAAIAAPAVRD